MFGFALFALFAASHLTAKLVGKVVSHAWKTIWSGRCEDKDLAYARKLLEDSFDHNDTGNRLVMQSFPRGYGKRPKRATMRKAVKEYKRAHSIMRTVSAKGVFPSPELALLRFRVLYNMGSTLAAICDEPGLSEVIKKLDNIILHDVCDEATTNEFELKVMALQAAFLLSMYRDGAPEDSAKKLDQARGIYREMFAAPAFATMPASFRSIQHYRVGLAEMLSGDHHACKASLEEAARCCRASLSPRAGKHMNPGMVEMVMVRTNKLLKKANAKCLKSHNVQEVM
jgi:hypothetical protein